MFGRLREFAMCTFAHASREQEMVPRYSLFCRASRGPPPFSADPMRYFRGTTGTAGEIGEGATASQPFALARV